MEHESDLRMIDLEPVKPAVATPHADAQVNSFLFEAYDTGRWNSIIDICGGPIARFIGSFPHPIFDGGDVTKLYLSSQAYKSTGEKDKYIACLKILYSLTPFSTAIGEKYRDILETGAKEYVSLSQDLGVDYLNEFQVTGPFKGKSEKSGCFIATAVYGSYNSPEVIVLRKFRNTYLLTSTFGKIIVQAYYLISPKIAEYINHKPYITRILRKHLLDKIVKLISQRKES